MKASKGLIYLRLLTILQKALQLLPVVCLISILEDI